MKDTASIHETLDAEMRDHRAVAARTLDNVREVFPIVVEVCRTSLRTGHKLLFFGNGGSAADAQHLATELVVRYRVNRPPMSAIALTTDTSALTAIGNDFGFADIFARQIDALCQPGDVAIGISTSGDSENVVRGLDAARRRGGVTIGFGGGTGGRLRTVVDHAVIIPSDVTARIQEMHILLGHALCALLEEPIASAGS